MLIISKAAAEGLSYDKLTNAAENQSQQKGSTKNPSHKIKLIFWENALWRKKTFIFANPQVKK
jgi:hypothetical protein